MKKIALAMAIGAVFAAPLSLHAQDAESFYVGGNLNHYLFDHERFTDDANESTVLGGNVGYRMAGPIALELGYGESIGDEDVDALTFSTYYYMNRSASGLAPYLVASFSSISFDDTAHLTDGDDTSEQLGVGFGVSKMIASQLEVKGGAQLLFLGGEDSSSMDLAYNLGVNYYFSGAAPAPAPVAEAAPAPAPAPAPAAAPQTRTITVKLNVEFEFDKADVRAIYGDELNAVANAMKAHNDIQLVLEGHTDAKGTDEYNQDLSQRRVDAVKAKLAQDYGIAVGRISSVGYGESRPVADNATDEGRARNRRVVGELSFTEVVAD